MNGLLVLILLPFEAGPVVRVFADTDRQEARLWEWFGAHPELAEIVPDGLHCPRRLAAGGSVTTLTTAARGLTVLELAARLDRSEGATRRLLLELELLGLARRVGKRWRLSDAAEEQFGPALRAIAITTVSP